MNSNLEGRGGGTQGEVGDKFYVVKEGEALVFQDSPQGQVKVNHLFKGDFFGERALLTSEPRSVTPPHPLLLNVCMFARDRARGRGHSHTPSRARHARKRAQISPWTTSVFFCLLMGFLCNRVPRMHSCRRVRVCLCESASTSARMCVRAKACACVLVRGSGPHKTVQ